ncbi:hypothetical protein [Aquihabitans sp. McL0605]|uniref:hypothetical protein n=1 Tax=Aquihabitans sp. McL0605 TaxID=3415671 RepID=UPI003CEA322F
MVLFTTAHCDGACVVHLVGSLEESDEPSLLADHLVEAAAEDPLLVDLSGLHPAGGPKLSALLRCLASRPTHSTTVLIHPDLETRRLLRADSQGLPVLPSNDLGRHGRFASALIARSHPST